MFTGEDDVNYYNAVDSAISWRKYKNNLTIETCGNTEYFGGVLKPNTVKELERITYLNNMVQSITLDDLENEIRTISWDLYIYGYGNAAAAVDRLFDFALSYLPQLPL